VHTKKIIWIGTIVCATLLVLAVAVGRYSRPSTAASASSPWNPHAIEGTLAGVHVSEIDPTHAAVVFLYDLDNRTGSDYKLSKGPNIVIMSRLKSTNSLSSDDPADIESSAFLPAGNRARIALQVVQPFSWPSRKDAAAEKNFRDLVAGRVAGLRGFVLFDQASRYQIELPAEIPELEQSTASVSP
jgi:hypothetical protein